MWENRSLLQQVRSILTSLNMGSLCQPALNIGMHLFGDTDEAEKTRLATYTAFYKIQDCCQQQYWPFWERIASPTSRSVSNLRFSFDSGRAQGRSFSQEACCPTLVIPKSRSASFAHYYCRPPSSSLGETLPATQKQGCGGGSVSRLALLLAGP